eukprot:COSAG06_NODE_34582_length_472_cov_1.793566_1_plen_58_part_10
MRPAGVAVPGGKHHVGGSSTWIVTGRLSRRPRIRLLEPHAGLDALLQPLVAPLLRGRR